MGPRTTADRDRDIHIAFQAGRTITELGKDYELTGKRIRAVLIQEDHRRTVSPEPFYSQIRDGKLCEG